MAEDRTPYLSLVVPTYNESENVPLLVERLEKVLNGIEYEVIVVDDDSPDQTWKVVDELAESRPHLQGIRRVGERGLSGAVMAGFRRARGAVLGVMDADLQHDEAILPRMVDEARVGAEFVVATRFAKGGGTGDWSRWRLFQSRVAAELANLILNVHLTDPMSGFFLAQREVFERVESKLTGSGFKILLEMYFFASPERIAEVPYVFRKRERGESKLSTRVIFQYIRMLISLRMKEPIPQGLLRFGVVGGLGALVNTLCLTLFVQSGFAVPLASALAVQIAIVHNFLWNDAWTFSTRRRSISKFGRFWRFQASAMLGLVLNVVLVTVLHTKFHWDLIAANLCGIAAAVVSNFVLSKLWTWRESSQ